MLTLEEIRAAIVRESNSLPITRNNYSLLADRAVPPCGFPLATARAFPELPEWAVYAAAQLLQTTNWLDLACTHAAVNQVKRAAERFCQSHAPDHNAMSWEVSPDGQAGWWKCDVCGYRFGSS
jgi:hypothetical protein